MLERRDPDLTGILKDTNKLILNSNNSLTDIIYKLTPKIKENSDNYKKAVEDAIKNTNYNKAKEYEEKNMYMEKEKDFILSQNEVEKNMLQERIRQLETENKLMTDKLIRKAKTQISDSVQYDGFKSQGKNNQHSSSKNNTHIQIDKNEEEEFSNQNINQNNDAHNLAKNNSNQNITRDSKTNQNNNLLISNSNQKNNNFNNRDESFNKTKNSINTTTNNAVIGPVNCRVLTKKIMLEIVQEIYESKNRFDLKSEENGVVKETMEQHMYTYLNFKYGLKNLIIEWASSIINGIRMFSSEDSEICLFGKILRNELEEESRFIIQKMKSTIAELLVYFLKAKFPLKISKEIKDMSDEKMNGILNEDEWKGIIFNVYDKEDADILNAKIMDFIVQKLGIFKQNKMNKYGRNFIFLCLSENFISFFLAFF